MNHNKSIILFLFIFFLLILPSAGETEWIDCGKKTLYWGETININDYTIEAVDFSPSRFTDFDDDWVLLEIYEDGAYLEGTTLSINNSQFNDTAILCNDKLKIVVKDVITGYDIPSPYAIFQVYILKEETASPPITPEQWINNTLELSKFVTKEIHAGDWIDVEIRVEGLKDIDLNIIINDFIPAGFELVPNPDRKLVWNLSLSGKKNSDSCCYSMKASKPGTFIIPSAKAIVEYHGATYTKTTEISKIIIHGPDINLTKTAQILENKSIAVTVSVRNIGDRATMVYITDEIPENADLVLGDPNFNVVAQPDKIYSNDYIFKTNNNIDLPAVTATFKDYRERQHEVRSEIVHVTVQTPLATPSPTTISNSTQTLDIQQPDNNSINEKLENTSIHDMLLLGLILSATAILYNVIRKKFQMNR